jgi:hypothetical protein
MKSDEPKPGIRSPLAAVARSLEDWEAEAVTGGCCVTPKYVEKPGDGYCGPVGSTCTGWVNENGTTTWGDLRGG